MIAKVLLSLVRFTREGLFYFFELPLPLGLFGLGISGAVFLFLIWQKVRRKEEIAPGAAVHLYVTVLYMTLVFLITTMARTPGSRRRYDLNLFHTLHEVRSGSWYSLKLVFFNLSLLFPMGILAPPSMEYRCGAGDILFLAFLESFSIECTQYLFRLGLMEADDLVYNCTGALAGYFLALLLRRLLGRPEGRGRRQRPL